MIRLCRKKHDTDKLVETLLFLAKRRSQSKGSITAIVEEVIGYLDSLTNEDTRVKFIEALSEITEGKIYMESEGAKLAMMLSELREERGDIQGACAVIQDVHVETFGSMSKLEKAEYILHQIRLNLLNGDFIRGLITSRKIHRGTLEGEEYGEVKVRFYEIMIDYYTHEKNPWEIAQVIQMTLSLAPILSPLDYFDYYFFVCSVITTFGAPLSCRRMMKGGSLPAVPPSSSSSSPPTPPTSAT